MKRTVSLFFLLAVICACLNAAESIPPVTTPSAIDEEALPISSGRPVSSAILDAELKSLRRTRMLASCKVSPLSEIEDPEALAFEKKAESDPANIAGLTPDTAQALESFKEQITSLGGTFDLKSAYRPTAYQAHLHEVWVKWVKELRNNRTKGCAALREEVGAEFKLHQLLIRQQPVPVSDHAAGLAFDAAVAMPRAARINGKRVTVDKLAAMAGIKRPNTRRDPVHYKLIPEHPAAESYSPKFDAGFLSKSTTPEVCCQP